MNYKKERGSSAGYIGSNGESQFKETLNSQKTETDTIKGVFDKALADFPTDNYGEAMVSKLNSAISDLNKIEESRNSVQKLSITTPKMAAYYTGTITKLLDVIKASANLTTNAGILTEISTYIAILEAKEKAGQERAAGAGSYAGGAFNEAGLQKLVSLIAQQDAFMATFNTYASAEDKSFYAATVKGADVDRVDFLRDYAKKSAQDLSGSGATGTPEWFKVMTVKIDLIKKVEDRLANGFSNDSHELATSAGQAFWFILTFLVILLGAVILFSFNAIQSIVKPLERIKVSMAELSGGNLQVDVPHIDYGSEIGEMANAVEIFKKAAFENQEMQKEAEATRVQRNQEEQDRQQEESQRQHEETEREAERENAATLERQKQEQEAIQTQRNDRLELAKRFEDRVIGVLESVSGSASSLNETSQAMANAAERTQEQSVAASSVTRQASGNVEAVAAASEEMSASISEITRQVSDAAHVATGAVEKASEAAQRVDTLRETATKIGDVVRLISDIAEQTNLLALNATIEAARAGEAGKGFAVVASEVKSLATQTASATEEIGSQINEMQLATTSAVTAVEEISATVKQINEISTAIAAAVEEQSAATNEISRNAAEASTGTEEVSRNIEQVNELAAETGVAASSVLTASDELAVQAKTLRQEVDNFLKEVRAD